MRYKHIYTLMAALSLFSCTKEKGGQEPRSSGAITIEASIGERTKGSAPNPERSAFLEGDQISLYAWTGSAEAVPAKRVVDGVVNTRGKDGTWTPASPMLWKNVTDAHYFLGIFPARAVTSFTADPVSSDEDLLIAINDEGLKAPQTTTDAPVDLVFGHMMAKLNVNVKYSNQWGGVPEAVVTADAATEGTIDYLAKTITPGSQASQVLKATTAAAGYSATYTSLCIPQAVNTIRFTIEGQTLVYTHSDDITLEAGKVTTLLLTAGKNAIVLEDCTVSGWEENDPIDGGEAEISDGPAIPEGALSGKFSVSADKQVYFAKGNLQATISGGSATSWSFATNQYDYIGTTDANNDPLTKNGTIDLFGWSADGAGNYAWGVGSGTSTDNGKYAGNFKDWGSNEALISALGAGWSTLSSAEWVYVFDTRTNGSTIGSDANVRFAKATVNSKAGMILFPDDKSITLPSGLSFTSSAYNNKTNNYTALCSNITTDQWSSLEGQGCVFLPAAGRRSGTAVYSPGSDGIYWSSTPNNATNAYSLSIYDSNVNPADNLNRRYGYSVRLVCDAAAGGDQAATVTDLSMVDCAGNARAEGKMWTANCYMVHKAGDYKLPLVYGNAIKDGALNDAAYTGIENANATKTFPNHAGTAITAPWITKSTSGEGVNKGMGCVVASAALLWQDAEGLITKVGISGDYLTLTVGKDAATQEGNAVIAAKTSDGTVVWSWHIWVTKETFATLTTIATGSHDYQVTPVNLGWVSTATGDNANKLGYNTFYQWGRKDAFKGTGAPADENVYDISGTGVTGFTFTSSTDATIADNIQNPTTFYNVSNSPCTTTYYNMWDAQNTATDDVATATKKTVYDPCPPGFCVPTGNLYSYANGQSSSTTWDGTNKGRTWSNIFFPASGNRNRDSGELDGVGSYGYCWSASPGRGNRGRNLYFSSSNWYWDGNYCARCFPVRPVAEESSVN